MRRSSAERGVGEGTVQAPPVPAPGCRAHPGGVEVSTVMTGWRCARVVVSLCSTSRRRRRRGRGRGRSARFVLAHRFDGGLRVLVRGSQGPCWRAAFAGAPAAGPGRRQGLRGRDPGRSPGRPGRRPPGGNPPSPRHRHLLPGAPVQPACAGRPAARRTMTWNEQNQPPGRVLGQGRGQDPRGAGARSGGQLPGRLVRPDPADARQHHMVPVSLDPDRAGREPARPPGTAARLESRESRCLPRAALPDRDSRPRFSPRASASSPVL